MSDKSDESDKKKGLFINSSGVACIPCRCKRQSYHKETKTIKENNVITTNIIEDRHNIKIGGRHVSPDETGICKPDSQTGRVEICDTGWGKNQITPEECEQRIEENTTDIEAIKQDIERLELELNELKIKIIKKIN